VVASRQPGLELQVGEETSGPGTLLPDCGKQDTLPTAGGDDAAVDVGTDLGDEVGT
jgi:hypothetical protein